MYTKEQVDEMLFQVEQEFNNALGSIAKNEDTEIEASQVEEVEVEEIEKSEEPAEYYEEAEAEDYETIDDLYASMSKNEIEAHYESVKRVMFGEAEEESMTKSESEEEESEEIQMVKSENSDLKEENEELKKSLENIENLINKMFNTKKAPSQKAITATNYIAKSEEEDNQVDFSKMTKGEITSKLKSIDYSSLEKSDREAINEYCLNNGSVEKIKHLIKE
jgi:hypothetical protein